MNRTSGSRWVAAGAASGMLIAAFVLPVQRPLPFDLCALHRLTGMSCLTCGLTRSVCLFAHGQWHASFAMHPAGWLAFTILAIACAWLLAEAVAGRDRI